MLLTNLYLIKPSLTRGQGKRQTFRIDRRVRQPDGSTKNEKIFDLELNALNASLLAGRIDFDSALKSARSILKRLKAELGLKNPNEETFNKENEKILAAFLSNYFKKRINLVDKDSARYKFERAVRTLGELSLMSATEDELQAAFTEDTNVERTRDQIRKINTILKFLKRDVSLVAPLPEINEVVFITEDELKSVLVNCRDKTLKMMVRISFYSGLRIGELYAIQRSNQRDKLQINSQIDKNGKKRLPKNRKKRAVPVSHHIHEDLEAWFSLPQTEKDLYTRHLVNKHFQKICFKVLKKKVRWHDLRHSYAVRLISNGAPIALVAQSLGNSVVVCEKHYSGHVLTSDSIENLKKYF